MIIFKFEKPVLEVQLVDGSLENVIKTIHWRYTGENENGILADVYGANSLPKPEAEGYIPFEQLTEEIVVGWLESVLDVSALEKQIEDAIYLINNPVMVQLSLPNN